MLAPMVAAIAMGWWLQSEARLSDGPQPAATESRVVDFMVLGLDDVIARLPAAGEEWRRDPETHQGREDPASVEMARRVKAGGITDAQWEEALRRTGAVRFRVRWPKGADYAVSMTVPRWLGIAQIRLSPRSELLHSAEVGDLAPGLSGTFAAIDARDARMGRELGTVPEGAASITFDVAIERGRSMFDFGEKDREPPPGMLWRGVITTPIQVVESWSEAAPPVAGPAVDEGVRDALGAGWRSWFIDGKQQQVAFLVVDPDCGRFPALVTVALDLKVEVLRDGEVVQEAVVVAGDADSLMLSGSESRGRKRFYGSANLKSVSIAAATDENEAARWSLRITGTDAHVRYLWSATERWNGSLTIPWTEATKHERDRTGVRGRGPEVSTPYYK